TEGQFAGILVGFAVTALASIATTLIALLINNSRLTDLRQGLAASLAETRDTLRAEIKAGDAAVLTQMAALHAEMKTGDGAILSQMATYQMDIISKIAELDNRITRLER
ncbi:MAG: hypothetical protein JO336_02925, partial [Acidobacteriia bacterium]|nr:hypothetical protein [Terriglobia bacterium]